MKNMISNKDENWKIVRNRVCIRALLIFLGALLMQMLAYMVCMIVMTIHVTVFDKKCRDIAADCTGKYEERTFFDLGFFC